MLIIFLNAEFVQNCIAVFIWNISLKNGLILTQEKHNAITIWFFEFMALVIKCYLTDVIKGQREWERGYKHVLNIVHVSKLFLAWRGMAWRGVAWRGVAWRGLVVMHSTKTSMVLASRPTACHWWRQERHPILNARARTKVLWEAPSKPQGIGGNGVKIEYPSYS